MSWIKTEVEFIIEISCTRIFEPIETFLFTGIVQFAKFRLSLKLLLTIYFIFFFTTSNWFATNIQTRVPPGHPNTLWHASFIWKCIETKITCSAQHHNKIGLLDSWMSSSAQGAVFKEPSINHNLDAAIASNTHKWKIVSCRQRYSPQVSEGRVPSPFV